MNLRVILIRATLIAVCSLLIPCTALFLMWLFRWRHGRVAIARQHFLRLMFSIGMIAAVWLGVLTVAPFLQQARPILGVLLLAAMLWQSLAFWRTAIYLIGWDTVRHVWDFVLAYARSKF